MNDHPDWLRAMYVVMAAFAGAVSALSFMKWRDMSWSEIVMTVFVSFSFAIILVPWIAADWVHVDINNLRAICAVVFVGGMSSNALMPLVIRKVSRMLAPEETK